MMRNNSAMVPKDTVTVVDILESGACIRGVLTYVERNGMLIAGPAVDTRDSGDRIARAANLAGSGSGDGYGSGSGDGSGYGSGYGYGSGDGSGDGYGSGYGYGDGYGYG